AERVDTNNTAVADGLQDGRPIRLRADVGRARCGHGQESNIAAPIRVTALAEVVGLWAKTDSVNGRAVSGEQADFIGAGGEFEADVKVRTVGCVLIGIAVGPDEQMSAGRDGVTGGNPELELVGEDVVGEVVPAEVGRVRARVVEFEPVIEVVVRRIGNETGVAGHPFVDKYV